jgi:hypothetical protein
MGIRGDPVIDYRGFTIKPKRDFAPEGFHLDGRITKIGYVVVRNGANPMPGAAWFTTIEQAKLGIDALIDVGYSQVWWTRVQQQATP